ncbi:inner centromere protein-like isoform X1 [Heteronotia binoei]|uniref:inner centromere protein-like isoform X1 n=1 Tax=Heteronotia binoei TaxID=13085 RepID=UPI00292F6E96|nr:inner centromere protein-like isoform X1 [Heteronotia binoei]
MAEATEPIHFLDVCNQKFSEFMFNTEHKCLMWLREIEEEAMKIFDSSLNAEPALMPKTPSQKKHRKKKRSSSFKDDSKELTRKRLSKRRSGVKPSSSIELSLSKENLKVTTSCKTNFCTKETLEAQCHKKVMYPAEEQALGVDFNKNTEVKGKMDEEMISIPEISTMCPDGHFADRVGATEGAGVLDVSAIMLPNPLHPVRTGKDWDTSRLSTSTPKPSLNVKPTGEGESSLARQGDNPVQEGTASQDLKDSSEISGGSRSGHRPSHRPHKNKRVSLVEKYSLTSKRKSMIRKSISKSIAKKKAAQNSSSTSSRVSGHSSIEVFVDDEASTNGPSLVQNAQSNEELKMLQKTPSVLDVPSLVAAENPDQPEMQKGKICNEESLAIKMTGSQVSGFEDSSQSNQTHEESIRSQSYKQALNELPAAQPTKDEDLSSFSQKNTSSANKTLSPSGSAKITQPFKTFFQTMQKSQLFKPPGSPGPSSVMKSLVKHTTPATKPDTRGEFVEKERQRLESLRKKQEAEQQRKQKVEEEKRRRLEEIKLKREERLRKALQARERVEQMEEEKRRRMEQKFSQHEERSEKVREEKMAEEKTKRKVSMKKMWDTEAPKQKALQMEEEQKFQEQPEKWKTVGEIKKMLEHNNAKQANERHHGQQDKEKWIKQLDLAVVTEEEENQKEEKSPTSLEPLPQEKKAKHVEVVPAASKWLNITAQKSPISTSNHVNPQDQKDSKSLKINPNDYGMDLNSDDSTDDESQPRRPIPPWATGLQLNEAVTYQYYNPPNIDTFFGQILSPKLEDIFYKSKPRYFKRTSSAVWQSPPLPGTKTALRASNSMKK